MPSPMGKALHIISVTRLLTHVTLDILKERSDQSPLYRKGVGGIGNIYEVCQPPLYQGQKKPSPMGKALHIISAN